MEIINIKKNDYLSFAPVYVKKLVFNELIPLHTHEFIEVEFIGSGRGIHTVDDKSYEVSMGDMSVINFGVTHNYVPFNNMLVYSCSFTPELFDNSLKMSRNINDISGNYFLKLFFENKTIDYKNIRLPKNKISVFREIYDKMIYETDNLRRGYEDIMRIYVIELLTLVSKEIYNHKEDGEVRLNSCVDFITDYINNNYSQSLTYELLARKAFISRAHLIRLFVSNIGMNIFDYIQNVRIKHACCQLENTDYKIYDIMLDVGYRDMKYFNRIFKKHTNMTPSQYRSRFI